MPRVSPIQTSFLGGEISPHLQGRVETDRYKIALKKCLNYIPTTQGDLTRRPGTYFVEEVANSANKVRLVRFNFSASQNYMLEFGPAYIRFYKNGALLLSGGVPYTVVTTLTADQVQQFKYTQSADVMYIVHPLFPPLKLSRYADTNWTLTQASFLDGPYFDVNGTSTTFTASAATNYPNTVTITASSTTGVNTQTQFIGTGPGFVLSDLGRYIRMSTGDALPDATNGFKWVTLKITGFTDSTHVTAQVISGPTTTVATHFWRMGAWGLTTGWPATVTFYGGRLVFGGLYVQPQRVDGSYVDDFENMSPSKVDGTILDSHAFSWNLNSNDVNAIRWFVPSKKALFPGTAASEWSLQTTSPTDVDAGEVTTHGSSDAQPIKIDSSILFIQRHKRKIRDLSYVYYVDGYQAADLNSIAPHMAESGLEQIVYQREPQPIIWCRRADGVLVAMTYEKELDSQKVAWSRHTLGGISDGFENPPVVESLEVIPSPDGSYDEVWMAVRRLINGATKRYIERLTKIFSDEMEGHDAFFVDCGLTYDSPKTITMVSQANPALVTCSAHGFANGDRILITDVEGMSELNGQQYIISDVLTNSFKLKSVVDGTTTIDSSSYAAYMSGGKARKMITTVQGLDHLEGELVQVLVDGAAHPDQVVAGGEITLSFPGAIVHVGLGYNSDGQRLRDEAGSADGTSIGKTRRVNRVAFQFYRSMGLKVGVDFENMDPIVFRTTQDVLGEAVPLFSGIKSQPIQAPYDFENEICWRQDQPLPSTILSVMPQMVTQDRG